MTTGVGLGPRADGAAASTEDVTGNWFDALVSVTGRREKIGVFARGRGRSNPRRRREGCPPPAVLGASRLRPLPLPSTVLGAPRLRAVREGTVSAEQRGGVGQQVVR